MTEVMEPQHGKFIGALRTMLVVELDDLLELVIWCAHMHHTAIIADENLGLVEIVSGRPHPGSTHAKSKLLLLLPPPRQQIKADRREHDLTNAGVCLGILFDGLARWSQRHSFVDIDGLMNEIDILPSQSKELSTPEGAVDREIEVYLKLQANLAFFNIIWHIVGLVSSF